MKGTHQMAQTRGIFIVLEGTDGSGKSTQYTLLKERLEQAGHDVVAMQFPRYSEPSSYFVREYLKGNYGGVDDVGPYTASLFYALDRYQASLEIKQALEAGKVVLCDRFTPANMAHQGTKFENAEQRRGYFIWLDNLEYEVLGIPRPTLTMVLYTPLDIILERLKNREESSTAIKKDIHEIDNDHIRKSLEVYLDLCQLFPKDFTRIDSVRDGQPLTVEQINTLLWEKITPMLPPVAAASPTPKAAAARKPAATVSANPYIDRTGQRIAITEAGYAYLERAITNPHGNVYVFNNTLSPTTIAAAMARLSRRGDDMRVTILDEFAAAMDKDKKLLQRVITAYGDDSVQQLTGLHFVVEKASNLLTKKLEWGRLAAYLEQSTRYIAFDQQDEAGRYRFHIPSDLDATTRAYYVEHMQHIFTLYSGMVRKLTDHIIQSSKTPEAERDGAWRGAVRAQACDALRAVLPVATESTVGIYASGQAVESLIMHLLSDELPEAQQAGQELLAEARKVIPTFLERADKPDRGGAMVAYRATTRKQVQKLAETYLPTGHTNEMEPVTLVSYWPKNELDIVADMLYEFSDQPLTAIQQLVDGWPYKRKVEVYDAYMGERLNRRHRPGRALEKMHYSWDLVCDYGIFRDLQRHRMVDDLAWQALTPRYGYDVPDLVDTAGLTDDFEQCFQLSLELYSHLQQAGYKDEAQYATLLGHRMRWKITYNARQAFHFHELRTSPQGHPGYRKLLLEMHHKLAEVHPLLAEHMQFVNKGEDPELTRLSAERYTQFKLGQLDAP